MTWLVCAAQFALCAYLGYLLYCAFTLTKGDYGKNYFKPRKDYDEKAGQEAEAGPGKGVDGPEESV